MDPYGPFSIRREELFMSHASPLVGHRRRAGFTLIELLVVISIIALLISILLPALSGARKSGRAIKCQSHLHTLGQAMQMYADFYEDVIPLSESPQVEGSMQWASALLPSLGHGNMNQAGPFVNSSPGFNQRSFIEVLRRQEPFQCPEFPNPDQPLDYVVNGFEQPYTLGENPGPAGSGPQPQGPSFSANRRQFANLTKIDQPTGRIIYVVEGHANLPTTTMWLHDLFSPRQLPFGSLPRIASDMRHPGGINALFFDTHVERMALGKIDSGYPRPAAERIRWLARAE